jgi:hypothetical protein
MQRVFGVLALLAGALGLSVLVAGPGVDTLGGLGGGGRALSEAPVAYSGWAVGVLMGLALAWLAAVDWGKLPQWLRLQRRRVGLLVLGGLLASLLLLW